MRQSNPYVIYSIALNVASTEDDSTYRCWHVYEGAGDQNKQFKKAI